MKKKNTNPISRQEIVFYSLALTILIFVALAITNIILNEYRYQQEANRKQSQEYIETIKNIDNKIPEESINEE